MLVRKVNCEELEDDFVEGGLFGFDIDFVDFDFVEFNFVEFNFDAVFMKFGETSKSESFETCKLSSG